MTAPAVRLDTIERAIADIAAGRRSSSSTTRTARTRATSSSRPARRRPSCWRSRSATRSGVDLRADGGSRARPARHPADDAAQPRADAHGVHDLRRRPRRRDDRHLGGRPGPHDPGARRLRDRAATSSSSPATCSRCATARAACWSGRATPRPSVDLARLAGLTPAGAISELVNDDGTMKRGAAAARVRRRARPGAGLDRGPDPLPAHARASRCSGSPRPGCRRTSGPSARSATATWSTARSTSPWSAATSATAATCSCGCTRSA